MDLGKFVSLLSGQSLWFSALHHLGDPFEGSYARPNLLIDAVAGDDSLAEGRGPLAVASTRAHARAFQTIVYANCWHLNEHESAAMWDLYARSGQGIAIQTTFDRLGDAFVPGPPEEEVPVMAGVVSYLDYQEDLIPEDNVYRAILSKRKSFSHENELRLVVTIPNATDGGCLIAYDGVGVKVEISTLIERIYVAPKSLGWFKEAVVDVTKAFGFGDIPVEVSSLDDRPLE